MAKALAAKTPFKFKVLNRVTLPQLKIAKNVAAYIKFVGAMFAGKEMAPREGEATKGVPTLANVIDMTTGEHCQVICPAVMTKELNEQYPGETYVNRCFEVVLFPIPGKRYNGVTLTEIGDFEMPDGDEEAPEPEMDANELGGHPHDDDVPNEPAPMAPVAAKTAKPVMTANTKSRK